MTRRVYVMGYYPKNFFGRFEVWFCNAIGRDAASHVSFLFPKSTDIGAQVLTEIEAITPVIVEHPFRPKTSKGLMYYCDVTEQEFRTMVNVARSLVGRDYDKPGILGFVTRSRKQDPTKWFCSELVSHVFKMGGHPLSRKPDWKMTPFDVVTSEILTPVIEEPIS